MSEQTPLAAWLDSYEALAAEASRLSARLLELSAFPPPPTTADDVDRLLSWREHHAPGLDGPATHPRDLAAVAQGAARPFSSAARQAESTAAALAEAGERALVTLASRGVGVVSGRDLPVGTWWFFEHGQHQPMIAVAVSRLPPDHCLAGLLPAGELYDGVAVVLGPGVLGEEGLQGGRVVRPRLFYGLSDARKWTASCERQRRQDAEERRRVAAAMLARQRALDLERERADPMRRVERLERELLRQREVQNV